MKHVVKTILLLLNILGVAVLFAVKIGSVVNPSDFIFTAYASLVLLPIIIFNLFFVFLWAALRKWYFLISLITLVVFSGIVKSCFPLNFSKSSVDSTYHKVTVLSYNTMNMALTKKHTKDDPNLVVKYILDADADIVCLQEFAVSNNKHQFQETDFEKIFKRYPYKHVSFQKNKWDMNIGVATLSKYPIIEKRNINYDSEFNLSIYSDIIIDDDTIRVVNNHLESNRITARDMQETMDLRSEFSSERLATVTKYLSRKMSIAYKIRGKQADIIREVIKSSPYKILSCGDYNDVPSSYAYTTVKGKLKDAFKENGKGAGYTFYHFPYCFRIDYIMYDNSFLSKNFKIGKLNASDHFPVQVDIYLPR